MSACVSNIRIQKSESLVWLESRNQYHSQKTSNGWIYLFGEQHFQPSVKATINTTLLLIHLNRLHFCCVTLLSRDLYEHDGLTQVDPILAEEVHQPLLLVQVRVP